MDATSLDWLLTFKWIVIVREEAIRDKIFHTTEVEALTDTLIETLRHFYIK
jgi:hypothetical protein